MAPSSSDPHASSDPHDEKLLGEKKTDPGVDSTHERVYSQGAPEHFLENAEKDGNVGDREGNCDKNCLNDRASNHEPVNHETGKPDLVSVPEPLKVELPRFQGPLDLLVDLIAKHEIDIFDIPIALITEKYLDYLAAAERIDIQLGGQWLEMASTLLYIKSNMLIPKPESEDDELGPDPRLELVQRLLEYQMFREAARSLNDRVQLNRDTFANPDRLSTFDPEIIAKNQALRLRNESAVVLIQALTKLAKKRQANAEWVYELETQKLSLKRVVIQIARILDTTPRLKFEDLFTDHPMTRNRLVTTFLALLEMTRMRLITLFEARLDGENPDEPTLWIERAVQDVEQMTAQFDFSTD